MNIATESVRLIYEQKPFNRSYLCEVLSGLMRASAPVGQFSSPLYARSFCRRLSVRGRAQMH